LNSKVPKFYQDKPVIRSRQRPHGDASGGLEKSGPLGTPGDAWDVRGSEGILGIPGDVRRSLGMLGDAWDSWEIFGTPGDVVNAWVMKLKSTLSRLNLMTASRVEGESTK